MLSKKSRLVLLSPFVFSAFTLAACGGGASSGASEPISAANMVVSSTDTSTDGQSVALSTGAATTATAAAASTDSATPTTTAAAATTTDNATADALGYRRRNTSSTTTTTTTSSTSSTTTTAPAPTTTTTATTTAPTTTTTTTPTTTASSVSTGSTSTGTTATTSPTTTTTTTTTSSSSTAVADVTANFNSTTLNMPNPERGFYGWGADYLQNLTAASLANLRDSAGLRLTLGLIDLSAYRTQNLPQSLLDTLTAKFALLRSNGIKVIVRPVYNYDSSGADASVAQVKTHLSQLAPIFSANADVIGYVQAGLIGAWGEWHDSASGLTSDTNKAAIRDAVLAAVPSQFPVEFRYPTDVVKWFPTALTAANAFDGSNQSRVGVHNDCFMSDNTDVGTYSISSLTTNSQRTYTKAMSEYAPFGGETCGGFSPARMTCSDILSEGPGYHLSYLNNDYYAAFMSAWKSGGCYDQVARSMGYRLQLDQLSHSSKATRNTTSTFNIDLHNVGWSRMFSPRKLVVTLKNKSTGAVITGTASVDMRTLPSQATASTRMTVNVAIPSGAATGAYAVSISLPDIYSTTASNPYFAVRFANADNTATSQAWNSTTGQFDVGTTVTIQ